MAQKNKSQLTQDINGIIVTNNTGLITAVKVKNILRDMVDSFEEEGTSTPLGYTPENAANKTSDGSLSSVDGNKYPTVTAVKAYVDSMIQPPLGYTPEDVANKSDDPNLTNNSGLEYPTQAAVKSFHSGTIVPVTANISYGTITQQKDTTYLISVTPLNITFSHGWFSGQKITLINNTNSVVPLANDQASLYLPAELSIYTQLPAKSRITFIYHPQSGAWYYTAYSKEKKLETVKFRLYQTGTTDPSDQVTFVDEWSSPFYIDWLNINYKKILFERRGVGLYTIKMQSRGGNIDANNIFINFGNTGLRPNNFSQGSAGGFSWGDATMYLADLFFENRDYSGTLVDGINWAYVSLEIYQ